MGTQRTRLGWLLLAALAVPACGSDSSPAQPTPDLGVLADALGLDGGASDGAQPVDAAGDSSAPEVASPVDTGLPVDTFVKPDVGTSPDLGAEMKYDLAMLIQGGFFSGRRFEVWLLELPGRQKVGEWTTPLFPSGGSVNISISGLQRGKSYDVDYYSDANDNGMCDKADLSWRQKVTNVTGPVSLVHNADVPITTICP